MENNPASTGKLWLNPHARRWQTSFVGRHGEKGVSGVQKIQSDRRKWQKGFAVESLPHSETAYFFLNKKFSEGDCFKQILAKSET